MLVQTASALPLAAAAAATVAAADDGDDVFPSANTPAAAPSKPRALTMAKHAATVPGL